MLGQNVKQEQTCVVGRLVPGLPHESILRVLCVDFSLRSQLHNSITRSIIVQINRYYRSNSVLIIILRNSPKDPSFVAAANCLELIPGFEEPCSLLQKRFVVVVEFITPPALIPAQTQLTGD